MKKTAGLLIFALFTTVIFLSGVAFADPLSWRCTQCGETFYFDPRDSGYRNSFAQQHMAMHQSGRSSGSGGISGFGSTGDPLFDTMLPFFNQICQSAGQDIASGIFGPDPAQQQQIDAQMAALRAQQQAAALEAQRLREEQHQKLMGSLKKLPGSGGTLALKTLDEDSRQLNIKDITDFDGASGGSALDNLNRAAFLMREAMASGSQQEAAFYSEQAFLAAEGGNVDLNIPEVGPSSAVTEKDANAYLKMKLEIDKSQEKYVGISDKLVVKHQQYDTLKKAKILVEDKVKEQEEKVRNLSTEASGQEKAAEEQKLAEARKLLNEADQHADKAEKDLNELQKESEKVSAEILKKKKEQEKFLSALGKRR